MDSWGVIESDRERKDRAPITREQTIPQDHQLSGQKGAPGRLIGKGEF